MKSISSRAIRYTQNGRVFYATAIPAGDIIERSRVDIWSADGDGAEAGYQRAPSAVRLRDIANYVGGKDAILPAGGLFNARSADGAAYGTKLDFRPDPEETGSIQSGTLTIPPAALPLWIVDMQHRLGGLQRAIESDGRDDLRAFPILVTIADGLDRLEEVEQFELINTTQKKVRTDLARRLMTIQAEKPDGRLDLDKRGKLWEARGPIVADWLNRRGEIWKGRIIPPNKSKTEMPQGIVRETSFVTSLKPILQTPLFQRIPDEQVAELVDRYWVAVSRVFSDAFARPKESVIQKTPGVFSLHLVLPEVVELVRSRQKDLSVDELATTIESWTELGDDFWSTDNDEGAARYGSMSGFARLAAILRSLLPEFENSVL